jgi:hypothetical protein
MKRQISRVREGDEQAFEAVAFEMRDDRPKNRGAPGILASENKWDIMGIRDQAMRLIKRLFCGPLGSAKLRLCLHSRCGYEVINAREEEVKSRRSECGAGVGRRARAFSFQRMAMAPSPSGSGAHLRRGRAFPSDGHRPRPCDGAAARFRRLDHLPTGAVQSALFGFRPVAFTSLPLRPPGNALEF